MRKMTAIKTFKIKDCKAGSVLQNMPKQGWLLHHDRRHLPVDMQHERAIELDEVKVGTKKYDVVITETPRSSGRIMIVEEGNILGAVSYVTVDDKKAMFHILVAEKGKGFGKALMESFEKFFGYMQILGPFNDDGANLVNKYPEATIIIQYK